MGEAISPGVNKDIEKVRRSLDVFMASTFTTWDGEEVAESAKISMQTTPLAQMDYEKLRTVNPTSPGKYMYGQYTVNPETFAMNFEEKKPKVQIADMREFVGRANSEVIKAVVDKYSKTHHIPGIEYYKYLLENPDKIPAEMDNSKFYYFMGSVICDEDGSYAIPCVRGGHEQLDPDEGPLGWTWRKRDRVLLFEK